MKDEPENPPPSIKLQSLLKFVEGLFDANGLSDSLNEDDIVKMDLRTIPESQWVDHSTVSIPESFAPYLDSTDPITRAETNAIEVAMEKFYVIKPNWFITLCSSCVTYDNSGESPVEVIHKPLRFLLRKEP